MAHATHLLLLPSFDTGPRPRARVEQAVAQPARAAVQLAPDTAH